MSRLREAACVLCLTAALALPGCVRGDQPPASPYDDAPYGSRQDDDSSVYKHAQRGRYPREQSRMRDRERLAAQSERLQLERERLSWERRETERMHRDPELRSQWERDKARHAQQRRRLEQERDAARSEQQREQQRQVEQHRDAQRSTRHEMLRQEQRERPRPAHRSDR